MADVRVFAVGKSTAVALYQTFGAGRQSQAKAMAKDESGTDLKPVARTSSHNPKRRLRSVLRDVLNSATT